MGATLSTAAEAAAVAVPPGTALSDQGTARRISRYPWIALATGVIGACLLALSIAHISRVESKASTLLTAGTRTTGVVVSYVPGGRAGGEMAVRYTADGRSRVGVIHGLQARYSLGEEVTVIYLPHDPGSIRTPEESNESASMVFAVAGVLIGAILILGALICGWRAWRWPRLLATHRWRPYGVAPAAREERRARGALSVTPLEELDAAPALLTLGATLRTRAEKLRATPVVWIAGDPSGRVIVARPATRELFAARVSAPKAVRGGAASAG